MGKIFVFCRIKVNFCSWLYKKKRWHTSWKFQLEIASNKKVIAIKPLTNLYEMNSRYTVVLCLFVSVATRVSQNECIGGGVGWTPMNLPGWSTIEIWNIEVWKKNHSITLLLILKRIETLSHRHNFCGLYNIFIF